MNYLTQTLEVRKEAKSIRLYLEILIYLFGISYDYKCKRNIVDTIIIYLKQRVWHKYGQIDVQNESFFFNEMIATVTHLLTNKNVQYTLIITLSLFRKE